MLRETISEMNVSEYEKKMYKYISPNYVINDCKSQYM